MQNQPGLKAELTNGQHGERLLCSTDVDLVFMGLLGQKGLTLMGATSLHQLLMQVTCPWLRLPC